MGAPYRILQADFSSGEIDPMVEANYNLPYRANGLKESYNTLHLPNATVSKRPGLIREIADTFGSIGSHDSWTMVEMQMESGKTCILFLGSSARVILDGKLHDVPIYASEEEGETETISLAPGLRHTGVYQQYLFISYPEDTETGYLMLHVVEDETDGVRVYRPKAEYEENLAFPEDIGACTRPICVVNGRLIIGSKNVFNASMQRTERKKESDTGFPTWMNDFTLAKYTYSCIYTYKKTVDGYIVTDTIYYESVDTPAPEDPFDNANDIVKRVRNIHKDTSDTQWEEYVVTDNYDHGNVYVTDIVKRNTTSDGTVEAHTSESYPDKEAYPDGTLEKEEDSVPDVQATYGIQVRETDMYGASIKWIAMAGRIIVGTDTAIHIAVDQYLDPRTFDLVLTSYTGTSSLQPKLLNSFVIFTSSDRKKLYMGIYSDEAKGFSITEATQNVKHLFLSGIKDYFISDNPYRVIYVLTNDGECRVCIPVFLADGTISFAWSTWDFGVSQVEYICFDRRAGEEQKTYFIMRDSSTDKGWIYTLDYREPYLYGEKDTELLLDYADIMTVKNVMGSVELSSPFLRSYGSVDVMLTYADGKQAVLRDRPVTVDSEGVCTVDIDYERTDLEETDDVTMKVGRAYETRIAFFQQLLPNNAGVSLVTRHSVERLYIQLYRSQGGEIWAGGAKVADILQLIYGRDLFNDNATNPLTGKPYTFTGIYTLDTPIQNTEEDGLEIITADPYPFNLMAVSMKCIITELT